MEWEAYSSSSAQHFTQSSNHHTLFTKTTVGSFLVVLVYVDDIILTSNSLDAIQSLKAYLHATFQIKDIGDLRYFLGIEVARCQRKYACELLEQT